MLFPITVITLVGCVGLARTMDNRRSPLLLALAVWLGSALIGPVLFRYRVSYSTKADVFTAVCLAAMTCAYLSVRARAQPPPKHYAAKALDIRVAQLLGTVGIVGCVLLLADARNSGTPLSLNYLLGNLGTIRDRQFDALASSASQTNVAVVGTYLASCSYLTVIAAARLGRVGGLMPLAATNYALITAATLLRYGGRATLFNLALLLAIGLYLGRRRLLPVRPRSVLIVMFAIAAVWYFSVPWLMNRESEHSTNPTLLLAYTQRAELRPFVASITRNDQAAGIALVGVGYFTSPLPTLAYYVEQEPLPGPLWGAYSFPLPTRTVAKLNGTDRPTLWLESRNAVFLPFTRTGYFGNVWATVLRDVLVDFGYLGGSVFFAGFGAFLALARNAFERTGEMCYHYLEVIACFTVTFGAFTSVLNSAFLSSAFFIALVIALGMRTGLIAAIDPRCLSSLNTSPASSVSGGSAT